MNVSKAFKETILAYLQRKASADELFAKTFAKENKNIDDCLTYILNWVKQSNYNGFEDDEIYSRVVVNHTVELTEEEKEQAYNEAMRKARDEAYSKIKGIGKKTTTNQSKVTEIQQGSLF